MELPDKETARPEITGIRESHHTRAISWKKPHALDTSNTPVEDLIQVSLARNTKKAGGRCVTTFTHNNNNNNNSSNSNNNNNKSHHGDGHTGTTERTSGSTVRYSPSFKEDVVGSPTTVTNTNTNTSSFNGCTSTFESIWGKAPCLPAFPRCSLSQSARPAMSTAFSPRRSDRRGSGQDSSNPTHSGSPLADVMVTLSAPTNATSVGGSALRFGPSVNSAHAQVPQHGAFSSVSTGPSTSPTGAIIPFNVSSGEYSVSGDGGRRFQTSYCGTGHVVDSSASRSRSRRVESASSKRFHYLSLESSAASSVNASMVAAEESHRAAHVPHQRVRSPTRSAKKSKRTLSVFMVLDDVETDEVSGTEVHHPMRFPVRGRGGGTAVGSGYSHSHSHRRGVVSIDDPAPTFVIGTASAADSVSAASAPGAPFHPDDLTAISSQHSATSILTGGMLMPSVRTRLAPAAATAAASHPHMVSIQAPLSPSVDTVAVGNNHTTRFSLCSQLVTGAHHASHAGRSQSSDWNVSPAVSVGAVVCGPGRDRRTRPRWQVSGRAATGAGATNLTASLAEAGMDESTFPIINFDFEQLDE